uniref:Uncharacterized protein n=1 Tax=Pseudo-nitzschia australis TaxID=44445 RepID=A0A7S4AGC2_9STRA
MASSSSILDDITSSNRMNSDRAGSGRSYSGRSGSPNRAHRTHGIQEDKENSSIANTNTSSSSTGRTIGLKSNSSVDADARTTDKPPKQQFNAPILPDNASSRIIQDTDGGITKQQQCQPDRLLIRGKGFNRLDWYQPDRNRPDRYRPDMYGRRDSSSTATIPSTPVTVGRIDYSGILNSSSSHTQFVSDIAMKPAIPSPKSPLTPRPSLSKELKLSTFTSGTLERKRRLEAFAKSWKETTAKSSSSSSGGYYDSKARRQRLNDFVNSFPKEEDKIKTRTRTAAAARTNTITCAHVINKPSNEDDAANTGCPSSDTQHSFTGIDIGVDIRSVLPPQDPFEAVPFELNDSGGDRADENDDDNRNSKSNVDAGALTTKGLLPQIIFGGSCAFLLVSVALFSILGAAKLHNGMQSIKLQWEDLQFEATAMIEVMNTNATDKKDAIYPLSEMARNELNHESENLYKLFGDHCPKIGPALCSSSNGVSSSSSSSSLSSPSFSSMCQLDGVPLEDTWANWLHAMDEDKSLSSSLLPPMTDTNDSDGRNSSELNFPSQHQFGSSSGYSRYGQFFQWMDHSRDDAIAFFSHQDERVQDRLTMGTWTLWMALIVNLGLAIVAIVAIVVLLQMVFEALLVVPFSSSTTDAYSNTNAAVVSSCSYHHDRYNCNRKTQKIIAGVFWILVTSTWIFGMCFSVAVVLSVDICTIGMERGEQPNVIVNNKNAVALELVRQWQSQETYHHRYDDAKGDRKNGSDKYDDASIFDLWKDQLQQCSPSAATDASSSMVAPAALLIPTQQLLEDLSRLAEPTQNLANGLQTLPSSEMYENMCGKGNDIIPLIDASRELAVQVCKDAQVLSQMHLEWITPLSCGYDDESVLSQLLPIYNDLVNDTFCHRGLQGLAWATSMQVLILVFALVVWTFRFVVLGGLPQRTLPLPSPLLTGTFEG